MYGICSFAYHQSQFPATVEVDAQCEQRQCPAEEVEPHHLPDRAPLKQFAVGHLRRRFKGLQRNDDPEQNLGNALGELVRRTADIAHSAHVDGERTEQQIGNHHENRRRHRQEPAECAPESGEDQQLQRNQQHRPQVVAEEAADLHQQFRPVGRLEILRLRLIIKVDVADEHGIVRSDHVPRRRNDLLVELARHHLPRPVGQRVEVDLISALRSRVEHARRLALVNHPGDPHLPPRPGHALPFGGNLPDVRPITEEERLALRLRHIAVNPAARRVVLDLGTGGDQLTARVVEHLLLRGRAGVDGETAAAQILYPLPHQLAGHLVVVRDLRPEDAAADQHLIADALPLLGGKFLLVVFVEDDEVDRQRGRREQHQMNQIQGALADAAGAEEAAAAADADAEAAGAEAVDGEEVPDAAAIEEELAGVVDQLAQEGYSEDEIATAIMDEMGITQDDVVAMVMDEFKNQGLSDEEAAQVVEELAALQEQGVTPDQLAAALEEGANGEAAPEDAQA